MLLIGLYEIFQNSQNCSILKTVSFQVCKLNLNTLDIKKKKEKTIVTLLELN